MKEQFTTYEIALKLKELGFDEECFAYFHPDSDFCMFEYYDLERQNSTIQSHYGGIKQCTAPLWQQVIDWFRENHKLHIELQTGDFLYYAVLYQANENNHIGNDVWSSLDELSYYEARKQAILKTIELCKNNL